MMIFLGKVVFLQRSQNVALTVDARCMDGTYMNRRITKLSDTTILASSSWSPHRM